jgi:hypothetical protein
MNKMSFFNIYNGTFETVKKNKLLFTLASLLDLGFVITFLMAFWQVVYENIFPILVRLSELMAGLRDLPEGIEGQAGVYNSLASSLEFMALYSDMLRWIFILAVVLFLLFVVFEGLNFFVINRIIDKKTKFLNYLGKFSLFSLFFYVMVVLSFWLSIYLSFLNNKMLIPVFNRVLLNVILIGLLVLIKYFSCLSFVMIRKKNIKNAFLDTFKTGVLKIKDVLKVLISVLFLFFALVLVGYIFIRINIVLFYLGFLLLVVPGISFAKIVYFKGIDRIIS